MSQPKKSMARSSCTVSWPAAVLLVAFASTVSLPADAAPPVVFASIKPVHSLVSSVMEGIGEPHLFGRGAISPHTANLRPSDAAKLQEADIVFWIGQDIESTLAGPIEALGADARIVELSQLEGLIVKPFRVGAEFETHEHNDEDEHNDDHEDEAHNDEDEHEQDHMDEHAHDEDEHGQFDMHIWLEPLNAGVMVNAIAQELSLADPENEALYMANAEAVQARFVDLNTEVEAITEPVRGVPFVVFHDAYRYFEERYGLTAVGLVVVAPEQKPGARRLRELREKIVRLGAKCVFAEPQFNQRIVETLTEGTDVTVGILDPLGAEVEDGPGLYTNVMLDLANSFRNCLGSSNN